MHSKHKLNRLPPQAQPLPPHTHHSKVHHGLIELRELVHGLVAHQGLAHENDQVRLVDLHQLHCAIHEAVRYPENGFAGSMCPTATMAVIKLGKE